MRHAHHLCHIERYFTTQFSPCRQENGSQRAGKAHLTTFLIGGNDSAECSAIVPSGYHGNVEKRSADGKARVVGVGAKLSGAPMAADLVRSTAARAGNGREDTPGVTGNSCWA
jgi:hypothetical protein